MLHVVTAMPGLAVVPAGIGFSLCVSMIGLYAISCVLSSSSGSCSVVVLCIVQASRSTGPSAHLQGQQAHICQSECVFCLFMIVSCVS